MKDLISRITSQKLTRCAAIIIFAGIVSSCTSQSSVSTVSATGQGTITTNFNLSKVCPNSANCVSPSALPSAALLTSIMGTATYAVANPNQFGFFPFYSYELKGTCDLTVASLSVSVTYTNPGGTASAPTTSSVACNLSGIADFVLNFTNGDGMYAVSVTPENIGGTTSGSGANFAVYAKQTAPSLALGSAGPFTITNAALTNVIPSGTATFATGGLSTLANPSGAQQILFTGVATSATLTLTGHYDNTQDDYVTTVKDTSSGLGQPGAPVQATGVWTEVVTITPGTGGSFTMEQVDLAGNTVSVAGFSIFTNKYVIPLHGALAGGGAPLSGAPSSGGHTMAAFTIMPIALGNNPGVSSSKVPLSGHELFVGIPAIAAQGPSTTETSNP